MTYFRPVKMPASVSRHNVSDGLSRILLSKSILRVYRINVDKMDLKVNKKLKTENKTVMSED